MYWSLGRGVLLAPAVLCTLLAWPGLARAEPLFLPPGHVVEGPVFKQPGQCPPPTVPQIVNGADANAYICGSPPTLSFVPTAPASMVVTTEPTQYVRVYCPECTPASQPNRSFMVEPAFIRGQTPEEIRDTLALPAVPSMITTVMVPAGTCVLVAQGAAVPGWGSGGTPQAYAAGTPSGANCEGLQFLPEDVYINRQGIGAFALLYGPNAGGGNVGAVAAALDQGPYPDPFTDMDLVYKKLDLLNFGDTAPLRAALVQLDGEVYADISTVVIGANQLFLGTVRDQLRRPGPDAGRLEAWATGYGADASLEAEADAHDLDFDARGIAGGVAYRFSPSFVAGMAVGWAHSSFGLDGLSGSGTANSVAITPYARFSPGAFYVEGAVGGGWNDASVDRTISFPGVYRRAHGEPGGTAFLSQVETGYRIGLGARASLTPFASLQGIVFDQDDFAETGAGGINLDVEAQSTSSAYGILGGELGYSIPVGAQMPLEVTGRIGWAHEYAGTDRTATAFFTGTPSAATFTVTGAAVPEDAVIFGGGLSLKTRFIELFARYEGTSGGGETAQGGSAGLRMSF